MQAESAEKIIEYAKSNSDIFGGKPDFEVVHHYPDRYFQIDTTAIITSKPSLAQQVAAYACDVSPPNYRVDRLDGGMFAVY